MTDELSGVMKPLIPESVLRDDDSTEVTMCGPLPFKCGGEKFSEFGGLSSAATDITKQDDDDDTVGIGT